MKTFLSDMSGEEYPLSEKISGKTIGHSILNFLQKKKPQFTVDNFISLSELNILREQYIYEYLLKESGVLSELEKKVITSLNDKTILSDKLDSEDENEELTLGQRITDKVAEFGGSWKFIISFAIFISIWIALNVFFLTRKSFDPYPFILLNLILSCIAALQAPVIMMSQNRLEEKDRDRAKKDYMINLKSELEIRILHEKIDHLIIHQQHELLEIQKVQIEMMTNIMDRVGKKQPLQDKS